MGAASIFRSGKRWLHSCRKFVQRRNPDHTGYQQGRRQEGQASPAIGTRSNVGIYYKELPEDLASVTPEVLAADWDKPYQVSESTSAYSTMIPLPGGNIAFYYEEHEDHNCKGGYDMAGKLPHRGVGGDL